MLTVGTGRDRTPALDKRTKLVSRRLKIKRVSRKLSPQRIGFLILNQSCQGPGAMQGHQEVPVDVDTLQTLQESLITSSTLFCF